MSKYCPRCATWFSGLYHACPEDFRKCLICGLEWRRADNCPRCADDWHDAALARCIREIWDLGEERDQARDWCRMLVHLLGSMSVHMLMSFAEYRVLPPELRAAAEA